MSLSETRRGRKLLKRFDLGSHVQKTRKRASEQKVNGNRERGGERRDEKGISPQVKRKGGEEKKIMFPRGS